MRRRAALVVLDGVGCGAAHDAHRYGDEGSDTLGNVARAVGGLTLPTLEQLGLGRCVPLDGVAPVPAPLAAWGRMQPASAGKDSTSGHWELCGVVLDHPFPTFPHGFPAGLIDAFARRTGRGVLGNRPASGTQILEELGEWHCRSGQWIVYTSADSVFQVAAHLDVVPLAELYAACEAARQLCVGDYAVSRVIARPFTGEPGAWRRTADRRDWSVPPPATTLLDRLADAGVPRRGVGKVDDLFAGRAITSSHAATNVEAYRLIEAALRQMEEGFLFANVVEFDQTWGHRNDVAGFHGGLAALDRALDGMLAPIGPHDLVIITADHGNDPTTPSTDHSRELVPLLVLGGGVAPAPLGERATFADVGQTLADFFGVAPLAAGTSFLREVWRE